MCEELKFSKKISISTVKKNIEMFEISIQKDVLIFLKKNYNDDDYYMMLKKTYFDNLSLESLQCKVCSRAIKATSYLAKTCGSDSCKRQLYASMKGKKRPEHAIKMSKIINDKISKGEFWNEEHRKNNRKHVNSINMKKQELLNKGVIKNGDYSNDEILTLHSAERRRAKTSKERIDNELESFLSNTKYIDSEFFSKTYFDSLQLYDLKVAYKNKVVSLVSKQHNPNMGGYGFAGGYFKGTVIRNLIFNQSKLTTVVTKSSYETNFITFFESTGIKWDYEPEVIFITYNNCKRKTIPDFHIYDCNDNLIRVIEVKGYIANLDIMVDKVLKTTKYYEEKGIPYYFCKMSTINHIDEIEECNCFRKTEFEIEKIVKKGNKLND